MHKKDVGFNHAVIIGKTVSFVSALFKELAQDRPHKRIDTWI